jgi:hypothetical protein
MKLIRLRQIGDPAIYKLPKASRMSNAAGCIADNSLPSDGSQFSLKYHEARFKDKGSETYPFGKNENIPVLTRTGRMVIAPHILGCDWKGVLYISGDAD